MIHALNFNFSLAASLLWLLHGINILCISLKHKERGQLHLIKTIPVSWARWGDVPFRFHHQSSPKHDEAQDSLSPKCFWLAVARRRHIADSETICTLILKASVLARSAMFATRCQGFAVSSSHIVPHEYAKRWDCQAAKSWSRAENNPAQPFCYCGDLSFYHWKYTWFIFYTVESAQLPTNAVIKDILLFTAFLSWFSSAHFFSSNSW